METNLLICRRVSAGPPPIAGAMPSNCTGCDAAIWIAPSSLQLIIDGDLQPVCQDCARQEGFDMSKMDPPTPSQLEEIRQAFAEKHPNRKQR